VKFLADMRVSMEDLLVKHLAAGRSVWVLSRRTQTTILANEANCLEQGSGRAARGENKNDENKPNLDSNP